MLVIEATMAEGERRGAGVPASSGAPLTKPVGGPPQPASARRAVSGAIQVLHSQYIV